MLWPQLCLRCIADSHDALLQMFPMACQLCWIKSKSHYINGEKSKIGEAVTPPFFRFTRMYLPCLVLFSSSLVSRVSLSPLTVSYFITFALCSTSLSQASLFLWFWGLKSDHIHAWPALMPPLCICMQAGEKRAASVLMVSQSTERALSIRAAWLVKRACGLQRLLNLETESREVILFLFRPKNQPDAQNVC